MSSRLGENFGIVFAFMRGHASNLRKGTDYVCTLRALPAPEVPRTTSRRAGATLQSAQPVDHFDRRIEENRVRNSKLLRRNALS